MENRYFLENMVGLREEEFRFLDKLKDACADYATVSGFRGQMYEGLTLEQANGKPGQLIRAAVFTANQHSESSEFWEAFRKGKLHEECDKAVRMRELGIPVLTCAQEEIADEIIRVLDKADAHGVNNIGQAVYSKMLYNRSRERLHGGKKA